MSSQHKPHHLFYEKWAKDLPSHAIVGEVGPFCVSGVLLCLEETKKQRRTDISIHAVGHFTYSERMILYGRGVSVEKNARDRLHVDSYASYWQAALSFVDGFFDLLVVDLPKVEPEQYSALLNLWSKKVRKEGTFVYYINGSELKKYVLPEKDSGQKRMMFV